MTNIRGMYVHIPFCHQICSYCDFYKMVASDKLQTEYIESILNEITLKKKYFLNLETIYIGGGTPSSLSNENLIKLLKQINSQVDMNKIKEFTIEVNPSDITDSFIDVLLLYNVNRISLGIQSFNDEKLKFMNRNHNCEDNLKAINLLKKKFANINADIIYGFPGDSKELISKDLDILIKNDIKHISTYSLILEEKTLLYHLHNKKQFFSMPNDDEAEIYEFIQEYLINNSFIQYEISNFALTEFKSLHNQIYWNNDHYIGIGAGASYYIDNIRYCMTKNIRKYLQTIKDNIIEHDEVEILSINDQMFEEIMLGLRKTEGVSVCDFMIKFKHDIFEVFPAIPSLLQERMLVLTNDKLFIPKDKLYISNAILVKIMK